MKPFYFKVILIALISINIVSTVFAAGMGGQGDAPCGGPFDDPCPIPLDDNIMLLFIVGAAYGSKKIYDSFKKNMQ